MAERNMSASQLENLLLSLEPSDCFDGPEADRDPNYQEWTVAEFCPHYYGEQLYVKLSIRVSKRRCKCLSIKLYSRR